MYNAGMDTNAVDRENKWLSIQEAADELQVNPRTIRRYIRLGRLEVSRISNKVVRIRQADLDRLMEANVPSKPVPGKVAEPEVVEAPRMHSPRPAAPARFSSTTPGRFS